MNLSELKEVTVIVKKAENGWWAAHIAEVSGAVSQGKTFEEAKEMALLALAD